MADERNHAAAWRTTIAVFIAALLLLLVKALRATPGLCGEGVAVVGAQRILEGQVPYRDFWTIYSPGSFYVLAGLFRLFGSHVLVNRVAAAVLMALSVALFHLLARRMASRRIAAVATLMAAILMLPFASGFGTYSTVLPCLLAALLCAVAYFRSGRTGLLFGAGLCASLALLFKHDVGGYIGLSLALTLIVRRVAGAAPATGGPTLRRELVVLALGGAAIAVPAYAALTLVAGPDMYRDLIIFPLTDFRAAMKQRYPGPLPDTSQFTSPLHAVREISLRLMHTLPAVVAVASAAWLVLRRRSVPGERFASQALLTICLPFFWSAAHVQINTHIYTMSLLCALIGAAWAVDLLSPPRRPTTAEGPEALLLHATTTPAEARRGRGVLIAAMMLAAVAAWCPEPIFGLYRALRPDAPLAVLTLPRAAGTQADAGMAGTLGPAVEYVRQRTMPGEPVYVGVDRHDIVITSAPLISFLLERPVPTRYHELHPAVVDTEPVQREMAAALERAAVRFLILNHVYDDTTLDAMLLQSQRRLPHRGARVLDDYIGDKYRRVQRFGRYTVWQRQAANPPSPSRGEGVHPLYWGRAFGVARSSDRR